MELVDHADMDELALEFDQAVAQTPDVDVFCSSSPWVASAYEVFSSHYDLWVGRSEHGAVALTHGWHERLGCFRQPLEASWCLASPFASNEPAALVRDFADFVKAEPRGSWDLLFLSGIKRDSESYHALVREFARDYFVGVGPPVGRCIASLEGGLDGFFSRRGSKFRANLRRTRRRADEEGIGYEYLSNIDQSSWRSVYERILCVEERSWKGMSGTGISDASMQLFYKGMIPRLASRGALRVLFVRDGEGEDIGFVFGGVLDGVYRGLQLSYDQDFRKLSPGNLAQLEIIKELIDEGVHTYDLGSELDYKSKWAEQRFETMALVIRQW